MINQIKNYIQLHTSDMDNDRYAALMRELSQWADDQANIAEYGPDEQETDE